MKTIRHCRNSRIWRVRSAIFRAGDLGYRPRQRCPDIDGCVAEIAVLRRRITRLLIGAPELRPLWAALLGVWACACRAALGAGCVVLLVGPVGGGPAGRGHCNLRTAASIRWPIHLTLGTAHELPSARYLGPSGQSSAGFLRQGMAV